MDGLLNLPIPRYSNPFHSREGRGASLQFRSYPSHWSCKYSVRLTNNWKTYFPLFWLTLWMDCQFIRLTTLHHQPSFSSTGFNMFNLQIALKLVFSDSLFIDLQKLYHALFLLAFSYLAYVSSELFTTNSNIHISS